MRLGRRGPGAERAHEPKRLSPSALVLLLCVEIRVESIDLGSRELLVRFEIVFKERSVPAGHPRPTGGRLTEVLHERDEGLPRRFKLVVKPVDFCFVRSHESMMWARWRSDLFVEREQRSLGRRNGRQVMNARSVGLRGPRR